MKPFSSRLLPYALLCVVLIGSAVALALPPGAGATGRSSADDTVSATQPPTSVPEASEVPAVCVEATPYDGSPDAPGDYRCAGIALDYHTAGWRHSPYPIWAGQYLFADDSGTMRRGWCTFNLGMHPTIAQPSQPVPLSLPGDPLGTMSGYLLWRYGDTTDDLTAAAMWAVLHRYARDAGGARRTSPGSAPLVPILRDLAAASGRADLQELAVAMAAEADRFSGLWTTDITLTDDGIARVRVLSDGGAVPAHPVSLLVSGSDTPLTATTGDDGIATATVPLPPSGTVTVAAVVDTPGRPLAYRGTPVTPADHGAQTLVVAGEPVQLTVTASLDLGTAPTTPTTTTPTTTTPTTTTPTTVAVDPPDDTVPDTTVAMTGPTSSDPAPTTSGVERMPVTGAGGDGMVAYLATASLVGGVGLLGTLRRRRQALTESPDPHRGAAVDSTG